MNDNELRARTPSLVPLLMWFSLAVLFAQIAQLPVFHNELDASINAHRTAMIAQHNIARDRLGVEIHPEYNDEIARCEFLMFRMQQLWLRPGRTITLTAIYVALVLSPFLFAYLFASQSLRKYDNVRVADMQRAIERDTQQTDIERQRLLRKFVNEAALRHHVDAPFNRYAKTPLLMPLMFAASTANSKTTGRTPRKPQ